MSFEYPIVYSAPPRSRPFATYPVAIQAVIINPQEELLLLASRTRPPIGAWQVVSGGLEAGETLLAGTLREVAEEAGPAVRVRPLGIVHAQTFTFDTHISHMLSLYTLLAYEGGEVVPGDDMAGSDWRWWAVDELLHSGAPLHPSADNPWLLRRAVQLYRLWRHDPPAAELMQPDLAKSK